MENNNEQPVTVDTEEETKAEGDETEENITVSKKDFTKMQRKAIAYDANKSKPQKLPEKEYPEDIKQDIQSLKLAESKRQFAWQTGLSPEETDAVFKLNPNPTADVLKDPFVAGGLERIRAEKRLANNIPSPSGGSFKANGKSWNDMDVAEKKANYPEYMKSVAENRRK